jgi:hypothetical protein
MTQPDLFGPAATPARQPQRADLPLLLAASADHAIGGALPATTPPVEPPAQFECWYFHGTGDPAFGGDADDRVLYTNGTESAFYRSTWEAKRAGMHRALFQTERAAIEAGQLLAPSGARVSGIRPWRGGAA